jgi:hypothetical protein
MPDEEGHGGGGTQDADGSDGPRSQLRVSAELLKDGQIPLFTGHGEQLGKSGGQVATGLTGLAAMFQRTRGAQAQGREGQRLPLRDRDVLEQVLDRSDSRPVVESGQGHDGGTADLG